MSALIAIAWVVLLIASIIFNFWAVGMRLMVGYFPEGRRWWQLPVQLASLAAFAAVVINHPFKD